MASNEPEVYTSYLMVGDKKIYFSGYQASTKSGTTYAIISTKDGRVSRGVNRAAVESFGNRSQLGKACEEAFQRDLDNGDLMGRIMDREMADRE